MSDNLIYFFMAIGLSMDAFSLPLAYGTTKINVRKKIILSLTVGIFHYIMLDEEVELLLYIFPLVSRFLGLLKSS